MTNPNSNVTPIESKQAAPACRFTINCTLSGFPIELSGEGKATDLKLIIERLQLIGAEPPAAAKSEPTKANGAPLCPVHNTPMAPSTKRPGTFYCKSSVGQHPDDGRTLYCTKKA